MTTVAELRLLPSETAPSGGDASTAKESAAFEVRAEERPTQREDVASISINRAGEILLGTLRDRRFKVKKPIRVKLTTEGEHIIAEAVDLDEFGFGSNFSEALSDLQRAIVSLFWELETRTDSLGADLSAVRNRLQVDLEVRQPKSME